MKLAIATLYDARDVLRGSGSYYHLCRHLEAAGHSLEYLGPVNWAPPPASRFLKKLSRRLGKRYRSFQDIFSARVIGKDITGKLSAIDYDVLLTNDYGIAGYVTSGKPIILYTDAIFPYSYARNAHPWLDNLSPFSVFMCQYVTRKGLSSTDLCCLASHWAAIEASRYGIKKVGDIKVIPYGANIDDPSPEIASTRTMEAIRNRGVLRLLFVGKDWKLKGGDIAVRTAEILFNGGFNVELHIVGTEVRHQPDKVFVTQHGLVSKASDDAVAGLHKLLKMCDLLILPSVAEGFGIVYAEAAAYGLPSLGYQTMGVTTSVKNHVSGILIEKDQTDPAMSFANIIQSWYEAPQNYNNLVRGSREYYESTVNWSQASRALTGEIEERQLPLYT